jgi:hypothetical protein
MQQKGAGRAASPVHVLPATHAIALCKRSADNGGILANRERQRPFQAD